MVAERGRGRDFVTAGVALESVSDNVQLLAAPVAENLKHFEHRGGRTAWERVRDRLAALSIEVNTRVVKGDIAGSTRPRQRPGHWPACRTSHTLLTGSRRGSMHAASAWCTAPQVVIASAGSARLVDAKGNQHVRERRLHPAKPHRHPRHCLPGVPVYVHGARSWIGSGPVIEDVNPR